MSDTKKSKPCKRDEWEIDEDFRAVKRAMEVFSDKDRLKDISKKIKFEKDEQAKLELIADGKITQALGL